MAGQGFLVLHKGLHMLGYPMQMHQDDGVPLLGVGLCPMRTLIIDVEQRRKPGTYEHLALLVRFLKSGDPFVFRVTADRKIFYAFPVGARNRLLGMYVQMRPEDDPLLHGLQRVMDTGGKWHSCSRAQFEPWMPWPRSLGEALMISPWEKCWKLVWLLDCTGN